ncbi:MAG: IS4 family transposase [Weeksellaceae bacterium]|jgi:IS4 transposase|nr:IS4 family transposase [Weeksellaceae bacterium]
MLVFDKAYNYYRQFAEWSEEGVNFVCRLKGNAKIQVQEVLYEKTLSKEEFGVYRVEHIHLNYKEGKELKTLCLRLVHYKDERGRTYRFITNNWEITAEEVALIYKYRWTIELTFRKLKQNFQLHFFYSETENGIKTQIWCTLIAYLLMNVIRVLSESKKGSPLLRH